MRFLPRRENRSERKAKRASRANNDGSPSLAMQHWINNRSDYEGQQDPAGLDAAGRNYSGVFINPPTPPDHTGHAPKYNFKHFIDPTLPPPPPGSK